MPITTLIKEAKKITPSDFHAAHAWLQDMLTTHQHIPEPVLAVRYFMLGLFSSGAIPFYKWQQFDELVSLKAFSSIH